MTTKLSSPAITLSGQRYYKDFSTLMYDRVFIFVVEAQPAAAAGGDTAAYSSLYLFIFPHFVRSKSPLHIFQNININK